MESDFKIMEVLTIIAILLGPIFAVQIEKFLERTRNKKERKISIFKTLMATRGSSLSTSHVEALNRIDLEFHGEKKYEKIISSWKEYFDNLGQKAETSEGITIWVAKNEELLANLLYEMGQSLGFKFDKVLIKRNIYSPVGHARIENEGQLIRDGVIDVLSGKSSIPMHLVNNTGNTEKQIELQEAMIKYYNKQLDE